MTNLICKLSYEFLPANDQRTFRVRELENSRSTAKSTGVAPFDGNYVATLTEGQMLAIRGKFVARQLKVKLAASIITATRDCDRPLNDDKKNDRLDQERVTQF